MYLLLNIGHQKTRNRVSNHLQSRTLKDFHIIQNMIDLMAFEYDVASIIILEIYN